MGIFIRKILPYILGGSMLAGGTACDRLAIRCEDNIKGNLRHINCKDSIDALKGKAIYGQADTLLIMKHLPPYCGYSFAKKNDMK